MSDSIRAQRATAPIRFAVATAALLDHLALGAAGVLLAPLLKDAMSSLRAQEIRVGREREHFVVNGQSVAPDVLRSWSSHLGDHGIGRIDFHRDASDTELLHFLALLAGPAGETPFLQLWRERGAWRIHAVGTAGDGDSPGGAPPAAAADVLRGLVGADGTLDHRPSAEELETLCLAVLDGVPLEEGSPLLVALRLSGRRATEALLGKLASAASGSQRRSIFLALTTLRVGHDELSPLLSHPTWYVARNAAALLGELRVRMAIPALSNALTHADARVRASAATALGQVGSPSAAHGLSTACVDPVPAVRRAAWQAWMLDGRAPDAEVVSTALRDEADHGVQRALLDCLAHYPELDVAQALVRYCAYAASNAAPPELLAHGIELLALRRPDSARPFLRHLADARRVA